MATELRSWKDDKKLFCLFKKTEVQELIFE